MVITIFSVYTLCSACVDWKDNEKEKILKPTNWIWIVSKHLFIMLQLPVWWTFCLWLYLTKKTLTHFPTCMFFNYPYIKVLFKAASNKILQRVCFPPHFQQTAHTTQPVKKRFFPAVFFIFMPLEKAVICLVAINLKRHMEAMSEWDNIRAWQRSDKATRKEGRKEEKGIDTSARKIFNWFTWGAKAACAVQSNRRLTLSSA